jgi:tRNA dimethylallyltransferase
MNPDDLPRAVAVVGPTASGKATLGFELARRMGLDVFVCDSVKVYRGLDIGSAKPTPQRRAEVRHHFVDLVGPDETFSAGDYARLAWETLGQRPGVFVGGTGFYLRAVTLSASASDREDPPRDDPARVAFQTLWSDREQLSAGAIHRALTAKDPSTASEIHPNNVTRALRALWLCNLHGEPISAVRQRDPPRVRLQLLTLVLDPGPAALDDAIERRVDAMLDAGWLAEVESLRDAGYDSRHRAMGSLGYKQLLGVVEGRSSLTDVRASIVTATRHYSRRQRTFFRHQLRGERVEFQTAADCPWDRIESFLDGGAG